MGSKKPLFAEPWVVRVPKSVDGVEQSFWWQGPKVGKGETASPNIARAKQFGTRSDAEKAIREIYGKVILKQTEPIRLAQAKKEYDYVNSPLKKELDNSIPGHASISREELQKEIEKREKPQNFKDPVPSEPMLTVPGTVEYVNAPVPPLTEEQALADLFKYMVQANAIAKGAKKPGDPTGVYTKALLKELWDGPAQLKARYGF